MRWGFNTNVASNWDDAHAQLLAWPSDESDSSTTPHLPDDHSIVHAGSNKRTKSESGQPLVRTETPPIPSTTPQAQKCLRIVFLNVTLWTVAVSERLKAIGCELIMMGMRRPDTMVCIFTYSTRAHTHTQAQAHAQIVCDLSSSKGTQVQSLC